MTSTTNYFAAALLDCGYADVSYIELQAEDLDIELSDVADYLRENQIPFSANAFISEMQRVYVGRIESDLDIELEEGKHYETFTNCMDSHIWACNDGEDLKADFDEEIAQKVIDHFEKW